MTKRLSIATEKAPAAIGPYSQAIVAGNLVFVSGQIPIDPQTGVMPEGIEAQTHQVLKNLQAILESAGSGLEHALKMTVFVQDINHFPVINEIYASYFGDPPPARSLVEVAKIPKNALIEMEAIALIP